MNKFLLTTLTLHVNILGININNVLIEYAIVRVKNCIHNKRMSGNKTSFIKMKKQITITALTRKRVYLYIDIFPSKYLFYTQIPKVKKPLFVCYNL